MAAEQGKQKFAVWAATAIMLSLLSVSEYATILAYTFVATVPAATSAVVADVPSETDVYPDDAVLDNGEESVAMEGSVTIGVEQEADVVFNVSGVDFCTVMRDNTNLVSQKEARRFLVMLCKFVLRSGNESTTGKEVTSIPDAGVSTGMSERRQGLVQTSNLNKLREWCKLLDRVNTTKWVLLFLPHICSTVENAGMTREPTTALESTPTVTADASSKTVAASSSAEAVATGVNPELEATYYVSNEEVPRVLCPVRFTKLHTLVRLSLYTTCSETRMPRINQESTAAPESTTARTADGSSNAVADESSQPDVISAESEPDATYNASDDEIGRLVCQTRFPNQSVLVRRALKTMCRVIGIPSDAADAEDEEQQQATALNKLSEWCEHRDKSKNHWVLRVFPRVCDSLEYEGINRESTAAPESMTARTADWSSNASQPDVIRVESEPDVTYNVSDYEFGRLVCQTRLPNQSLFFRLTTKWVCKIWRIPSDEADAEDDATSVEQQQATALKKISEWCEHRANINNHWVLNVFPRFCDNLEYKGINRESTAEPEPMNAKTAASPSYAIADASSQPGVIRVESESDTTYNFSDDEFGRVVCKIRFSNIKTYFVSFVLKSLCASMGIRSDAAGANDDTTSEAQQGAARLNKLSQWCEHRHQIDNDWARHFLPYLCDSLENGGTNAPDETLGTVTTVHVTTEEDHTTEATMDVATKAAYSYSGPSVVTTLEPKRDGPFNISDMEVKIIVCQNIDLVTIPRLALRSLHIVCKLMLRSVEKTVAATEATSHRDPTTTAATGVSDETFGRSHAADSRTPLATVTRNVDPSAQSPRVIKLSEVCGHLDQIKNDTFGLFLRGICRHLEESGTNAPNGMLATVTTVHVTTEEQHTTEATMDVATKAAYSYSGPSVVTTLEPKRNVPFNISDTEVKIIMCQNLDLIKVQRSAWRALRKVCKSLLRSVGKTVAVTETTSQRDTTKTAATGVPDETFGRSHTADSRTPLAPVTRNVDPSAQSPRVIKLREVCRHLGQLMHRFGSYLPVMCRHLDESDATARLPTQTANTSAEEPSTDSRSQYDEESTSESDDY